MSERAPQSWLVRQLQSGEGTRWGSSPEQYSPAFCRTLHRRMGTMFGEGRYFEVEVKGWDHLPERNALVVSNHSGGTTLIDMLGLWYAWQGRHGGERPGHGLAHEMLFAADRTGSFFAQMGAVRACRKTGLEVLRDWKRDILVAPGGDRDVWRPWRDRYQVNFAGRRGYARLAIQAGVPIVPIANAGAQSTMMVLTDGAAFASAVGIPRIARAEVFPISLSLPWGVSIGPWPHLPPPTRLRYRLGAPIAPPVVCAPGEEPPEEAVRALDMQVQASIQAMLDELRETSPSRQVLRGVGERLRQWVEEPTAAAAA